MSEADETVIELSIGKFLRLAPMLLVGIALGAWMYIAFLGKIQFMGLAIVVCIVGGLNLVRRLIWDRRILVFNSVGILDCRAISRALIRWDEIAGADIVKAPMQTLLQVRLKDPMSFINRQSLLKR